MLYSTYPHRSSGPLVYPGAIALKATYFQYDCNLVILTRVQVQGCNNYRIKYGNYYQ
jgi:hypothetical protein